MKNRAEDSLLRAIFNSIELLHEIRVAMWLRDKIWLVPTPRKNQSKLASYPAFMQSSWWRLFHINTKPFKGERVINFDDISNEVSI